MSFPCGSAGKESTCNAGDTGSVPGLGRSLGERNGYPVQCSDLENSTDYSMESDSRLGDFYFHFHFFHNGRIYLDDVLIMIAMCRMDYSNESIQFQIFINR